MLKTAHSYRPWLAQFLVDVFFQKPKYITNDILEIKVKENPQKIFQNLQQEKIYSET